MQLQSAIASDRETVPRYTGRSHTARGMLCLHCWRRAACHDLAGPGVLVLAGHTGEPAPTQVPSTTKPTKTFTAECGMPKIMLCNVRQ